MARRCQMTGKGVLAGNNVSHANNRTRRRFLPNLQRASLHSEALGMSIRVRLSVNALRTVERAGGIDAFLLARADSDLPAGTVAIKRRIKRAKEAAAKRAA